MSINNFTKIKASLALLALLMFSSQLTWAETEDPLEQIFFDEGTVLLHCSIPEGEEALSKELFEEAFPNWVANLKKHADEGRVLRAHFLGNIKQGFAVVVTGEDREEAVANAGKIIVENHQIIMKAAEKTKLEIPTDKRNCVLLEIGPVMVLPD